MYLYGKNLFDVIKQNTKKETTRLDRSKKMHNNNEEKSKKCFDKNYILTLPA